MEEEEIPPALGLDDLIPGTSSEDDIPSSPLLGFGFDEESEGERN